MAPLQLPKAFREDEAGLKCAEADLDGTRRWCSDLGSKYLLRRHNRRPRDVYPDWHILHWGG